MHSMHVGVMEAKQRRDPLELELRAVVSCLMGCWEANSDFLPEL